MVSRRCAARTCFNTPATCPNLKFFTFPKVESYTRLWIKACNRFDLANKRMELLSRYVLCSEHFEDHWFLNPKHKTAFIKNTIPIPTIFRNNFKEHMVRHMSLKILENNDIAVEDTMDFITDIKREISDEEEEFQFELDTSQVHDFNDDSEELTLSLVDNGSEIHTAERSLHKFCRLCACLISAELLTSIYDTHFDIKINKLLPHEVHSFKNDGLPEEVCNSCIEKLMICEDIIEQFVNADRKLRNLQKLQETERNVLSSSPQHLPSTLESELLESIYVKEEPEEMVDVPASNIIHLIGINTSSATMQILQKDLKSDVRVTTVDEMNTSDTLKQEVRESNDPNLDSQQDPYKEVESRVFFQTQPRAEELTRRTKGPLRFGINKLSEITIFKCIDCGQECTSRNSILAHSLKAHATLQNANHEVRYTVMRKKAKKKRMIVRSKATKCNYKCTVCASEFSANRAFRTHLKTHLPGSNVCEYCGRYFIQKIRLESHRKLHSNEKLYHCAACGESFVFSNSYRRHKQSHVRVEPLKKCDKCNKTFSTTSLLKKHEKTHEEQNGYLCSLCGKLLTTMNTFRSHLTTHNEERPFSCAVCLKTFKTSSQLSHHNKTHQKEKKFECNDCKKQFHVKTLLKQHMNVHSGAKPYVCDICGAKFNRCGNLGQHKKRHQQIEEPIIKCEICNKRQRSLSALTYHTAKHTGEKRPYSCDICEKRFVTIAQWRVHERFHTGERPYACSVCSKPFRSEATMKQHYAALHTDTFPYRCPYCERQFKRLHSLNVHKKTHTGERPYPCSICGRAFAQKGDMVKHTKIHSQTGTRRSSNKRQHYFKILEPVAEETVIQDVEPDPTTILTLSDADMTSDFLISVPSIKGETELA